MKDTDTKVENIFEYISGMEIFKEILQGADGDEGRAEINRFTKMMAEKYQPILDQINAAHTDEKVRREIIKRVAKQAGAKLPEEPTDG